MAILRRYIIYFAVAWMALFWMTVVAGAADSQHPLVGAYYYPWYGPDAHSTAQSLRGHLLPGQPPMLGDYDNASASVIASHIDCSHRANISFWVVSWWGPNSREDRVFKYQILRHARAGELQYALFYEATGRLGSFDDPDYDNLQSDFSYISANYFDNPHYLRFQGRPVVFIYLTRVYFRNKGDAALALLRQNFPELYIVGDEVFGRNYSAVYAAKWDAVTGYDVYGQSLGPLGSTQAAIDRLEIIYRQARTAAHQAGAGFLPAVTPGFNDKGVREGHDAAPRYFEDRATRVEGNVFQTMIQEAGLPTTDPAAGYMLMVTSFNEWHEDTQIEPTRGAGTVTRRDDSGTGSEYTEGKYYTDYGYLYLDLLFEATGGITPPSFVRGDINADGAVDLADAIFALNYLFVENTDAECRSAVDANDSGLIDLADAIYLLAYLFTEGPDPADPYPDCGEDPTEDGLTCDGYSLCD